MERSKVIDDITNSTHQKVKIAVVDIDGVLRGKVIHKDKFLSIVEGGAGFCDVIFGWDSSDKCYENSTVTGWHTAYPDATFNADLKTLRFIPWNNDIPFFLADFEGENAGAVCPRTLLKRVINEASNMGYKVLAAQEFEWFNFENTPNELHDSNFQKLKSITPGMFGYSMLRPSLQQDYFNALFDYLEKFDVSLEGLHTETGPGVYEAAIKYDTLLRAADKAVLFKNSVKEIAHKHGLMASFMAKWNENLPGCSGHIHQSLWKDGHNAFYNKDHAITEIADSYIAGVLHCLPHVLPMYVPTINSYKRLKEGSWAPTTVSWGFENRTVSVRLIDGGEKSTRVEMRIPGSDVNPYLAFAATVASGLYGIKNKLKLEIPAVKGNAYADSTLQKLPGSLMEATKQMKQSKLATELFGEAFTDHFIRTREWEVQQHERAVSDWELKRYFEII